MFFLINLIMSFMSFICCYGFPVLLEIPFIFWIAFGNFLRWKFIGDCLFSCVNLTLCCSFLKSSISFLKELISFWKAYCSFFLILLVEISQIVSICASVVKGANTDCSMLLQDFVCYFFQRFASLFLILWSIVAFGVC